MFPDRSLCGACWGAMAYNIPYNTRTKPPHPWQPIRHPQKYHAGHPRVHCTPVGKFFSSDTFQNCDLILKDGVLCLPFPDTEMKAGRGKKGKLSI